MQLCKVRVDLFLDLVPSFTWIINIGFDPNLTWTWIVQVYQVRLGQLENCSQKIAKKFGLLESDTMYLNISGSGQIQVEPDVESRFGFHNFRFTLYSGRTLSWKFRLDSECTISGLGRLWV